MINRSRFFAACLLGAAFVTAPAAAQQAGQLTIKNPWSRATPGGAKVGAGYLTIVNRSDAADKLVSVSSPVAGTVEVHEMAMQNNVMHMRPVDGALAIDAGKTVSLSPGGYHLMLMNLKAPLKAGDKVPVTLTFEKAGKVDVTLDVRPVGAPAPAGAMAPIHNNSMQMKH